MGYIPTSSGPVSARPGSVRPVSARSTSTRSVSARSNIPRPADTESSDKMSNEMQLIHSEIFAQLESKMKSTLNFEIDAAIKKSIESFKNLQITSDGNNEAELEQRLTERESAISQLENELILLRNENNLVQDIVRERDKTIAEQKSQIGNFKKKVENQKKTNSQQQQAMNAKCEEIKKLKNHFKKEEITDIQNKLTKQISDGQSEISSLKAQSIEAGRKLRCEKLKVKEKESEITKLNTTISNQNNEIEKLKNVVKKYSSQQTSQVEVNILKTKIGHVFKLMLEFVLILNPRSEPRSDWCGFDRRNILESF